MLKRLAIALLCVSASIACGACAASDTRAPARDLEAPVAPDNEDAREVLRAFERASNAHDLEALGALFTPDAIWYRDEVAVYRGRDEVLAPLAYDAATAAQFELQDLAFDGSRVSCEIVERNDFFGALGVESIRQSVEFELSGDQIRSVRSLSRDQVAPGERTVARFLDWLAREHRQDFRRLMYGSPAERTPHARELVAFAERWTAAGQPD